MQCAYKGHVHGFETRDLTCKQNNNRGEGEAKGG